MEVPSVKVLHQDAIHIPDNRIRREFNKETLEELAISIAGSERLGIEPKGLLHPIVLAYGIDLNYELVAGERRLRTMILLHKQGKEFTCEGQVIPKDCIPFTLLGDLSKEAQMEAEIEENTIRADLTWQEAQAARAKLHKLRIAQHGKAKRGIKDSGWSMQDTAEEVGIPRTSSVEIRNALILSEHMDDEDVARAKSPQEAMKVLRKKHIQFLNNELAKQYGNQESEEELDFRNVDMKEEILTLPDESFDCIVTDPPYGISAQDFGSQTALGHQYEDTKEYFNDLMNVFIPESFRIMKDKSHLYMFCAIENFFNLRMRFEQVGFKVWPRPIIWDKRTGMLPVPELGPRYTYECILYANKGKRPVTAIFNDIIFVANVDGKVAEHAAQKPIKLFEDLISRCCVPGDTVFDPFAGTGVVFPAANNTQVKATAFEKNTDTYNAALVSLKE